MLTARVRADIDANAAHHEENGLPGDATAVRLPYLALTWLVVEQLTLPEVFSEAEHEQLVALPLRRGRTDCGRPSGLFR